MLLDSARGLKQALTHTVLDPLTAAGPAAKGFALPAEPVAAVSPVQPSIALGISPHGSADFRIAVRCQRRELMTGKEVEQIRKKAKGEVDVRYVGLIARQAATPWGQRRQRPLRIGTSIGHAEVTAGTLGGFVKKQGSDALLILSNNHVLANENKGKTGDSVLQPGKYDGGTSADDRVAELAKTVRLTKSGKNHVDAAVAGLLDGIDCDPQAIRGLGKLAGLGPEFLDAGAEVAKLGRTTGLTRGRVTAFDLDNVVVEFGIGLLRFDSQFEVEGAGEAPFSQGGDSGSLIVEAGPRLAVGMLFAGTDVGGANDQGLTYAHPLRAVLDALGVALWIG
jgi:hypothetical protein